MQVAHAEQQFDFRMANYNICSLLAQALKVPNTVAMPQPPGAPLAKKQKTQSAPRKAAGAVEENNSTVDLPLPPQPPRDEADVGDGQNNASGGGEGDTLTIE